MGDTDTRSRVVSGAPTGSAANKMKLYETLLGGEIVKIWLQVYQWQSQRGAWLPILGIAPPLFRI